MMKRFAVIGHPIGHSLSPLMHNTAFQLLHLEYLYEAFDLEPHALTSTIGRLRDPLWGGFNITTPYKETIIPLIDEMSPETRSIGSVNTVVNRNGRLYGINTDIVGIQRSLEPFRPDIDGKNCLLLGAGGAARTTAFALVHLFHPCTLTISARSLERANNIRKDLSTGPAIIDVCPISGPEFETVLQSSTLVVNATTVGMSPNGTESPLQKTHFLKDSHVVFDLVYRPLRTRFLLEAKKRGARTIDGLEMFLWQGAAAFQLWTGREMPLDPIRNVLERALSAETIDSAM